jgi:hypothetical protein
MIVGFSHLTFSCDDLGPGICRLKDLGYSLQFEEIGVENAIEKKPLLQNFHPTHDLAFLNRVGALNIELINHHSSMGGYKADLFPVYRSDHPDQKWLDADLKSNDLTKQNLENIERAFGEEARFFFDVDLNLFLVWISNKANNAEGFIAAAILSDSLSKAEELVQKLKFRKNQTEHFWSFPSPFASMSISLILLEKNESLNGSARFLDSPGCTCLAFFGTGELDNLNFRKQLQTFQLRVNSSDLEVKFLIDSALPYIEVIKR